MLVTVITPCYNAEKYLHSTIESVVNQSFNDWELLIVDDCSNDSSYEIIKNYAEKDSRIKYLRTDRPSGSPSIPRNLGIENAQGEYIAFLDADDIWLPDKLERQVDFMESNNYPISYGYYEKIDESGIRSSRYIRTKQKSTYKSLLHSNSIPCLTAMIRRNSIGQTRFKNIPQEDFCFWLDILKRGHIAYNLDEDLALYRVVKGSRSENKIAMFKGYWNVIRNEQHINIIRSCYYMLTYTVLGAIKFFK